MFRLTYVSSATLPFSDDELLDLLARSRRNNTDLGVTGMLLYKDGNFMQVLEGEESAVRGLYGKIARDPRHRGTITLLEEPEAGREFSDWSMGFRNLGSPEVRATPGFNEFLNVSLRADEFATDPSRCGKLLRTFRKHM